MMKFDILNEIVAVSLTAQDTSMGTLYQGFRSCGNAIAEFKIWNYDSNLYAKFWNRPRGEVLYTLQCSAESA